MTKAKEEKCIVRVAFNKKVLTEGLESKRGDVIKDIRISGVMGVELLDPSASPAFAVRTISDQVQMVGKDLVTEWIFYVKALIEGTHPLVLKISVIEIKDGIERKRNVVLEEQVEILAEAPSRTEVADGLESSGYFLNLSLGEEIPKQSSKPVMPSSNEPETSGAFEENSWPYRDKKKRKKGQMDEV